MSAIANLIKEKLIGTEPQEAERRLRWSFRLAASQILLGRLECELLLPESIDNSHQALSTATSLHTDNIPEYATSIGLPGNAYMFNDYFCFISDNHEVRFCIPYTVIQKAARTSKNGIASELRLYMFHGLTITLEYLRAPEAFLRFCELLRDALRAHKSEMPSTAEFAKSFYSDYICSDSKTPSKAAQTNFGFGEIHDYPTDAKASRERPKLRLWRDYFSQHGRNLTLVRLPVFSKLIRIGIPNKLRGELWELCSGSLYLRLENRNEYTHLLKVHSGQVSFSIEEIEKDLGRSLPEYPAYQSEEGISSLRNVLVAFSWKNPDVGYCQAMNIVAAALLIHCSEEQTFWLMHRLCESYVPGYYSKTMYGTLLDQKVFESLVRKLMPVLYAHFINSDIQLSIVSLPWFLSLFFSTMPLQHAFRILDSFFLEGPRVLFQIGLAILYLNEEEIFKVKEDAMFISILKRYFSTLDERPYHESLDKRASNITRFQELLVVAFKKFSNITHGVIEAERKKFSGTVMSSIESFAKRTQIRSLQNYQPLTKDELGIIYDRYLAAQTEPLSTPDDTSSTHMDFVCFCRFMAGLAEWANDLDEKSINTPASFMRRLFLRFDKSLVGSVSLQDVVSGIAELKVRDVMHTISYMFELYDSNGDSYLEKNDVLMVSEALLWITRYMGDEYLPAVSRFIQRCFHYADEASADGGDATNLVDITSSEDGDKRSIGANSAIRVSLPTFRMVILSVPELEQLFATGLADSIKLESLPPMITPSRGLRGLLDSLVNDTAKLTVAFRAHRPAQETVTTSSPSTSPSKLNSNSEKDDELGAAHENDKDLLQFDPF
ncbi:GTPase activating protein [Schizosaccharomyces japonicus yFS275]|uniref:GTPase activating protein n=1 Tax=Schizosaccharomyces japonicus (strain yFS275 / FY16936) TaxID=402676 RepID=B6K5N7_SCHJY|nr:GTPase activating protein [Schizosaccharomyces japonicus yFS275]EEB08841.1 GTPase activating protein [Schizosaccharomyces japonicus yFS275]